MDYTTIQILPATRKKLAKLKMRRETYDEIINALLYLLPEGDEEGKYTEEFRAGLLRGTLDFMQGRVISQDEVKRRLGL